MSPNRLLARATRLRAGASLSLSDDELQEVASRVAAILAAREPRDDVSPWLTVKEAAEYLRCSEWRLYRLKAIGAIPHVKEGHRLLFNRAELDAWVQS
jgi:excisionase family DNA binding protein